MKRNRDYAVTAVGIILLVLGLYLEKHTGSSPEVMMALPYVCIGIGCGVFGHGMGNLITGKALQKDQALQKKLEIEAKDERNIAITSRAKAKGYDLMTAAFGALMVAFALMEVDLVPLLLMVFVYLFVHGYAIYYRARYDKEM